MDIFREVVAWIVVAIAFLGWISYLPQIKLLLKVKESKSVSLGLMWSGVGMQGMVLIHLLLQPKIDGKLVWVYITNLVCMFVVLYLIYRYRRWPGGKPRLGKMFGQN